MALTTVSAALYCFNLILSTGEHKSFFLDTAKITYFTPKDVESENEFWIKPTNECSDNETIESLLDFGNLNGAWYGFSYKGSDSEPITLNGIAMSSKKRTYFEPGDTLEIKYVHMNTSLKLKYSRCPRNATQMEEEINALGTMLKSTHEKMDALQVTSNDTNNYFLTELQRWITHQKTTNQELEALKSWINSNDRNTTTLVLSLQRTVTIYAKEIRELAVIASMAFVGFATIIVLFIILRFNIQKILCKAKQSSKQDQCKTSPILNETDDRQLLNAETVC